MPRDILNKSSLDSTSERIINDTLGGQIKIKNSHKVNRILICLALAFLNQTIHVLAYENEIYSYANNSDGLDPTLALAGLFVIGLSMRFVLLFVVSLIFVSDRQIDRVFEKI